MREIAFDTETTGLDPAQGHRIIEIGCAEMIDKIRTGRTFQCYINPERDVPEEAQRVHGITTAFLAGKPLFPEIVSEFLDFLGDSMLVIHNAGFDLKFLNFELDRIGLKGISFERAVDTVMIARRRFPGAPASLDALCRRFNIDLSARTKHGALLDAELLADVYLELNGGRQGAILFEPVQAAAAEEAGQSAARPRRIVPARRYAASAEELARHAALLAEIRNPIWSKYPAGPAE